MGRGMEKRFSSCTRKDEWRKNNLKTKYNVYSIFDGLQQICSLLLSLCLHNPNCASPGWTDNVELLGSFYTNMALEIYGCFGCCRGEYSMVAAPALQVS